MPTSRHRSFEVKEAQKVKPDERLTFDLGSETFHGVVAMPGLAMLRDVTKMQADGNSDQFVIDFIYKAVNPDEHERLRATLESETQVVELETLTELMKWLIDEYSGRPTTEPAS